MGSLRSMLVPAETVGNIVNKSRYLLKKSQRYRVSSAGSVLACLRTDYATMKTRGPKLYRSVELAR